MANKKARRAFILSKTGGKCFYCGCKLNDETLTRDHFLPVLRGKFGKKYPERDVLTNMVPSCQPCNQYKDDLSIEELRDKVENDTTSAINIVLLKGLPFYFEKENLLTTLS